MSATIDERVVEMRFDNKQFENNVQTSLSTLDKLKQSLNLEGAAKGLDSINSAAKNVNMSGLSGAVETVQAKFSALEVMAVTALANITNSVINTGKQMLKSLTIEPISQGFEEYELKMGSIQTIMMSTGASLEDVNRYLNELNTYSDKTIYSFSDMTSNIGKFTNAGVKLEDAVMAIQGVSNAAAVSGANANEASRAMYNFAQALSAGYVKLIDWKSIENANMATVEFKTQLLESAVACGTLEKTADGMYRVLSTNAQGSTMDECIDATHMFNDSLSYQWMTTEALVATLRDYADENTEIGKKAFQAATEIKTFTMLMDTLKEAVGSGWAQTWEIVFGDFEEAKKLWTEIGEVVGGFIDAQSDARNSVLQGWKDLGGRSAVIEAAKNAFKGLISVVTPVKEAFREIFPPVTAERLMNITNALKDFSSRLKLSDTASKNLKNTFKGLFAVLDIIKQAFSAVLNAVFPLFGGVTKLGGGILGVTGAIGEWLVKIDEFIKQNNIFTTAVNGIVGFVTSAANAFKAFVNAVKEKVDVPGMELIHGILGRIQERLASLMQTMSDVKIGATTVIEAIAGSLANNKILQALQALWNGLKAIGTGIASLLGGLVGNVLDKIGNADFGGILDLFNTLSAGAIATGITKFVHGFGDAVDSVVDFKESILDILNEVRGCFEAYQQQLKAGTLLKIASAIGILAAAILVISLIDSDKLAASLGAVTVLFADLMGSMAIFSKISGSLSGVGKSCVAMIGLSAAVLILAGALKKIGSLDAEGLAKGLIGVIALMGSMVAAMSLLSKYQKKAVKGATSVVIFAAAINILANACKKLSTLSWNELAKGLVGVGVLLAEVSVFLNTAKFGGKAMTTAVGIIILSAALKVLASVCKDFASMEWGGIAKGLTAIGALLLEIIAFTKLTGNTKHVISTGVALIAIAGAMKILASAMKDFGSLQWPEIGRGLTAMAGALTAISIAMKLLPKNTAIISIGLIGVGAALEIIADVMQKMGGMQWEGIAKGLVALGGSLLIIAVGVNAMKGSIGGAAALLIVAGALAVLTPVLTILGSMPLENIGKSLLMLAGTFTILGIAGAVLGSIAPGILAVCGSITLLGAGVALIGVGLLAAGAGLSALAVGFTALAASVAGGATAIVAGLAVIISGIIALIPEIIKRLGDTIVAICNVIIESAPAIAKAITTVIVETVKMLVEYVPLIAEGALQLILGVLGALATYTPQIVDTLMVFLINTINALTARLPELIQAGVNLLMSFFKGVVDALKGIDPSLLLEGIAAVGLLTALVAALAAIAPMVPMAMVGVLGIGAVVAEMALVLAAIGALAQIPGLEWLMSEGGDFLQVLGTAIGQFIGGIVGGIAEGISAALPQVGTDLSAFMTNITPFIEGAKSIDPAMMEGAKSLVEVILLLTAAELLDSLTSWLTGGSSLSSFAEELVPFGVAMKQYSESIAGINPETVTASAIAAKALAEMASNLPNSGGVVGWFVGENDMDQFAAQLIPFGEAMKAYGESVAGIDAASIESSAIAGQALTELANTVPNTGGVVSWFAGNNDLGAFAEQIIPFGEAMKLYGDAVAGIDGEAIQASAIAGQALTELADTVPNTGGVVSWFTGDNDLDTFGEQIVPFGEAMKAYGDAVAGIDGEAVTASATAGLALTELAATVPNTGGVVSWFTGDNDLDTFGNQIVVFGAAMKAYGDSVAGIDAEAVTASTTAGLALAALSNGLDNSGGVVSWFTGDNDLGSFAKGLIPFGEAMKAYGNSVAGIDAGSIIASSIAAQSLSTLEKNLPAIGGLSEIMNGGNSLADFAKELIPFGAAMKSYSDAVIGTNSEAITASANAAQSLSELEANLPALGGLSEIIGGGNDLGEFAERLIPFGAAMKSYSDAVVGINPEAVVASATAAQSLSQLEANLPDIGGISAWLNGDSDLGEFAERLIPFGEAMLSYSNSINGINPEAVTASATAAQALATLEANLPDTGGVISWFTGDNDLGSFAEGIIPFGEAMKEYSFAVTGINADAVVNSSVAGAALIELASTLPNTGGVVSWFTGENDLGAFAEGIVPFGAAMKEYSLAVTGIDAEAVVNSTIAGAALIELASTLPNTGGLVEFFTGGNDLGTFSETLVPFGEAIKSYSEKVAGIDADAVVNSATAGKALVELANTLPNTGGVVSWFTGENDLASFGSNLIAFGADFATYSNYMASVDAGIVTATTNAANSIVELQKSLPKEGGWFSDDTTLSEFGSDMSNFGSYFAAYYASVSSINIEQLSGIIMQTNALVEMANGMNSLDTSGMSGFSTALTTLGQAGITDFLTAFTNSSAQVTTAVTSMIGYVKTAITTQLPSCNVTVLSLVNGMLTTMRNKYVDFQTVGMTFMVKLIAGIRSKDATVRSTCILIVSGTLTAIRNKYTDFYNAGAYLVEGFANGISANTFKAEATARAMAAAAANAAKRELDEHSPSKVGYKIGDFFGVAFVNAISAYAKKAYNAGAEMASQAKTGLSSAISRISDFIDSDIDTQPTIRPVLDLTNIESQTGRLNAIFSREQAVSISTNMNQARNNGTVQNDKETGNGTAGNSYQFTQNNYSPKALSRIEIYRQTKNQFAAMKEALE